jgi:hypothetical protein
MQVLAFEIAGQRNGPSPTQVWEWLRAKRFVSLSRIPTPLLHLPGIPDPERSRSSFGVSLPYGEAKGRGP